MTYSPDAHGPEENTDWINPIQRNPLGNPPAGTIP